MDISTLELAQKINDFYYDFDTYGYMDDIENREEAISECQKKLESNDYQFIVESLQEIIDNEEGTEDNQKEAKNLIKLLKELKL